MMSRWMLDGNSQTIKTIEYTQTSQVDACWIGTHILDKLLNAQTSREDGCWIRTYKLEKPLKTQIMSR